MSSPVVPKMTAITPPGRGEGGRYSLGALHSGHSRAIAESTFVLAANGLNDSPPAAPVRQFLNAHGARRVVAIYHPLEPEGDPRHEIIVHEGGVEVDRRQVRLPSWPPFTYPLDMLVPLWPPKVDGWVGFNNLQCARGLAARRMGRAVCVVYWTIDFVPDRFGPGALTRLYERVDAWCARAADARFEVSEAAAEARGARLGLGPGEGAPVRVVPMGAWIDDVPNVPEDGWRARRVMFLGHLVARMGIGLMLEALSLLAERGVEFEAEVIGRGPLEAELRERARAVGLTDRVTFHGFVEDHRDVEAILARGSVALAPYDTEVESFTRFADPGKLKSYLAAGLPIVLTDVPPNAAELADRAGAELVAYDAGALADAVERALASPEEWARRRAAALSYARSFDWNTLLRDAWSAVGFEA
jgi:glycosyltransferase involved in cell wall biosynthesis